MNCTYKLYVHCVVMTAPSSLFSHYNMFSITSSWLVFIIVEVLCPTFIFCLTGRPRTITVRQQAITGRQRDITMSVKRQRDITMSVKSQ